MFDRTFGLQYAPVSMTQFTFTAGTIHLLGAANEEGLQSHTALVKRCIAFLFAIGRTWNRATQSGAVLQLYNDYCKNGTPSFGA